MGVEGERAQNRRSRAAGAGELKPEGEKELGVWEPPFSLLAHRGSLSLELQSLVGEDTATRALLNRQALGEE